jgi:hypothetical protein
MIYELIRDLSVCLRAEIYVREFVSEQPPTNNESGLEKGWRRPF